MTAKKKRYTIDVVEHTVRRYVVKATSEKEAQRIGSSDLVELSDVSGLASYAHIVEMDRKVQIVNVE